MKILDKKRFWGSLIVSLAIIIVFVIAKSQVGLGYKNIGIAGLLISAVFGGALGSLVSRLQIRKGWVE